MKSKLSDNQIHQHDDERHDLLVGRVSVCPDQDPRGPGGYGRPSKVGCTGSG